jgi:hypothetical protein
VTPLHSSCELLIELLDAKKAFCDLFEYFDADTAEISEDDSLWALATSRAVVDAVEQLLEPNPPALFQ